MNLTLEQKTIRPGSLGSYSYYHSVRRPAAPPPRPGFISANWTRVIPKNRKVLATLAVFVLVGLPMWLAYSGGSDQPVTTVASSIEKSTTAQKSAVTNPAPKAAATAPAVLSANSTNRCAKNSLDKLILVSVSQRHLWACEGSKTVRDTPVITGMLAHESTLTPSGTYHVYGKVTDTTLTGSDETGSWNRPVYYWMPFLDNQHGTYGFHDATWRADTEFGKVDPASSDASHGCVELPLGTTKWLYQWAAVGTTITIET